MNYIVSGTGVMTIVVDNKSYTVGYDHPNYMAIKECVVNNDESKIEELIDIPSAIEDYAEGKVTVTDGVLRYDGEEIHNSLTERIMGMMRSGFPFEPMIKFLANVLENHSNRAVQELANARKFAPVNIRLLLTMKAHLRACCIAAKMGTLGLQNNSQILCTPLCLRITILIQITILILKTRGGRITNDHKLLSFKCYLFEGGLYGICLVFFLPFVQKEEKKLLIVETEY